MPSISIPAITSAIATGLGGLGIGAETAGTIASIASPMLSGAGIGAAGGALTGGNVGQDALFGALGGGGAGALGQIFPSTMASLDPFGSAATMGANGNWIPGAQGFPASGAGASVDPGMAAADASANYGSGALSGAGGPLAQTSATAAGGIPSTLKALLAAGQIAGALGGPGRPNYGMLPGPAQNAATLGPLYGQNLPSGGYLNRTQVPNYAPQSAWYNYGMSGGQPAFFQGNQLQFPGMAKGGALRLAYSGGGAPGAIAQGHMRGPGDGQSDSIPAMLSDGEYVLTARDLAHIGRGSNEAGARVLDRVRAQGRQRDIPKRLKRKAGSR